MAIVDFLNPGGFAEEKADNQDDGSNSFIGGEKKNADSDIFKAFIPNFLYKPPYGMPRRINVQFLRQLAQNAYVFSVIKTFADEAAPMPWKIKVKEEFNEKEIDYSAKVDEVTRFFRNPNGNEESIEHIFRQLITNILELDAGVIVKVFSETGEFSQMFARDGATFLKNPDIYGYMGNRADFVPPLPDGFTGVNINLGGTSTPGQQQLMRTYNVLFKEQAAYFQYGWTAGSMPVPFGKREIVYIMQNPRPDSIYGRSPIEVLGDIIMNLVYGSEFSLDFYTNNNMPEGVISLLGAQQNQIKQFRENWENNFRFTDSLGKKRKRFFKVPLTSTDVKFTPFTLSTKEIELIAQQKWFSKVLWAAFGITAEEMGFTEDSNRAISKEQTKVAKRKAIRPLLNLLEYHINTQILPEFFAKGTDLPDYADVPIEFLFNIQDIEEDMQKHTILQMEINMGVKTPEMVAKELGINVSELKESKQEGIDRQKEMMGEQGLPGQEKKPKEEPAEEPKKEPEEKSVPEETRKESEKIVKEIDKGIDEIEKRLVAHIDDSEKWVV